MKISYEWLKDFTDVPADLTKFSQKITLSGSKVEASQDPQKIVTNTVVSQIVKIEAHKDADRLKVCQVDIGQPDLIQIVTNGTNIQVGDKVPVALDGATLYGDLKIKKGKIRGVHSDGMFCSLSELGLAKELFEEDYTNKILLLPPDLVVGENVLTELRVGEAWIEFEITSNRPDCFSVEGLGRESAITFGMPFKPCKPYVRATQEKKLLTDFQLKVEDSEFCPLYFLACVENVKVQESPFWLKKRLLNSGLRPINNIVDITNYVMLELGHPMHAFDYDKIKNATLKVRKAYENEKIITLDGTERTLTSSDYVIADQAKPVALAGVMGGQDSGVSLDTKKILLEVAYFSPEKVRKTSQRQLLRTDSSARFERIVDKNGCLRALKRACQLIEQLAVGDVGADFLVAISGQPTTFTFPQEAENDKLATEIYQTLVEPCVLKVDSKRINNFLGTKIQPSFMEEIFQKIGCHIQKRTILPSLSENQELSEPKKKANFEQEWELLMPTYRPDLEGFSDLAEEIARFYDYNNIEAKLLFTAETTQGGRTIIQKLSQQIKYNLVNSSFYETYSNPLTSPDLLADIDKISQQQYQKRLGKTEISMDKPVKIRNAAYESGVLRTSLLPDLCRSLKNNAKRQVKEANIFEWSTVFKETSTQNELPTETKCLGLACYDLNLGKDKEGRLFFKLKHEAQKILEKLGYTQFEFSVPDEEAILLDKELLCLNPYRSAVIKTKQGKNTYQIAYLGYLLPTFAEKMEITEKTAVLIFNMDLVFQFINLRKKQKSLPKFPSSTRDLALVMEKDITCEEVIRIFKKNCGSLLEKIELFDIYEGKPLTDNQKSLAFHLDFRSNEATLTDAEIVPLIDKSLAQLENKLNIKLRMF